MVIIQVMMVDQEVVEHLIAVQEDQVLQVKVMTEE